MTDRVLAVVLREWAELRRNSVVVLSVILPPLLFAALPLGALYTGALAGPIGSTPELSTLRQALPELSGLNNHQTIEVLLMGQFMLLLLLAPLSAALTIGSYSIVGEKQLRTLEPLLATPIRTWELLVAKTAAAAVPAVLAGWFGYALLVFVGGPKLTRPAFDYLTGPTGLLLVFLLAPLIALLGVGVAVLGSSRAADPRAAQQIGALVVLPILGLVFAQVAGLLYLGPQLVLAASLLVLALDTVLLAAATRVFDREAILTRWT